MAVVLLVVIGVSVTATLYVTGREGGRGATALTTGRPSDYASANDTGPVSIITDEPTCGAFLAINDELAAAEGNGWGDERGMLGTQADWTPQQRERVESVAVAMRSAALQTEPLVRQTPHRVIRELYEQFIAYGIAYADSFFHYVPSDNEKASVNVNISASLFGVCQAIEHGSALRRASTKPSPRPEAHLDQRMNRPTVFMPSPSEVCPAWSLASDDFNTATREWQTIDPNFPEKWTPEQWAQQRSALSFIIRWAGFMRTMAWRSQNVVLKDFANTAASYLYGHLRAGDSYVGADGWLRYVAFKLNQAVQAACRAPVK